MGFFIGFFKLLGYRINIVYFRRGYFACILVRF